MDWNKILNIDIDSDVKTIKKAYANLLKKNNPEDNPQGYQELRQAYDEAIKSKKIRESISQLQKSSEQLSIKEEKEIEENIQISSYREIRIEEKSESLSDEINKFLARLNEIYSDIVLRLDLKNWQELFSMRIALNMESTSIIEGVIFEFLYKHKYLPPKVWRLIESIYHWMSNELELYNKYEASKVKEIIKIMKNPNELDYNTISNSQNLNLQETIDSFELINKASKVCTNGTEDEEFLGNYMMLNGTLATAIIIFQQILQIDNTNIRCAVKLGISLFLMRKYKRSIGYLEMYVHNEHNKDIVVERKVLYCLGKAYYLSKNYSKAKYFFQEAQKVGVIDENIESEINEYLKIIDIKLKSKIMLLRNHINIEKIILMLILISFTLFISIKAISFVVEMTEISSQNRSNNKTKYVGTIEDFESHNYYRTYSIYFNDIISCDQYVYYNDHKTIGIANKEYIEDNKLWEQVYSKVFVGTINGENIMFVDKNFSMKLVDKDGGYTVTGIEREISTKEPIKLNSENGEEITIDTRYIEVPEKK